MSTHTHMHDTHTLHSFPTSTHTCIDVASWPLLVSSPRPHCLCVWRCLSVLTLSVSDTICLSFLSTVFPSSTSKLISSTSFHCLDMTLAVAEAEALNPNKPNLCLSSSYCLYVCLFLVFQGDLKKNTVDNLELYVHKDERLPIILDRWDTTSSLFALPVKDAAFRCQSRIDTVVSCIENLFLPSWR